MNKNSNTPTPNKRTEVIRLFAILIPTSFVLFFGWLGLVILFGKMGLELSAERVLLGVIALMIGVGWAWLSLKGRMPLQEGETLSSPPPPCKKSYRKTDARAVFAGRNRGLCGCGNDARCDDVFFFAYLFFWTRRRYAGNVGFIGNAFGGWRVLSDCRHKKTNYCPIKNPKKKALMPIGI
ncbi:hypothetical protein QIU18_11070 [Capnocytophaga canimorsus]|nr:hypothetical protein [Capnocytophaga canimorsus]WGU70051.1 hypothetical protein QIU18_11070 [Capnocytophaga canimorsus]